MRLFKSFLVALTVVFTAGSAAALVTVTHTAVGSTTDLAIGSAVTIRVTASWDGEAGLFSLFSSTASGDASVLVGESAVSGANPSPSFRGSLFAFTDGDTGDSTSLGRFGQGQLRQAVDGANVIRSVQYGSLVPILPGGAAQNQLVATLTFRAVGAGTTTIGYFLALGDTGAQGNGTVVGAPVTVTVIPEPGTALLMGLGLAGLGLAGRRS